MPADPCPCRDATDDWNQLRLLVTSPAQETYELLRPIVLFGEPMPRRARETGIPERTLQPAAETLAQYRVAPYRLRRPRRTSGQQAPLFA